jgi:hypothetical protein
MKTAIVLLTITVIGASPGFAQSCDPPGEMTGITDYHVQAYGASPQRIALDNMGGIHVVWTGSPDYPSLRNVYYNFKSETGGVWLAPGNGIQVDAVNGAGFPALALQSGGEAAIAYHNISHNYSGISLDAFRGFGIFTYYDVPDLLPGGNHGFWPQAAISTNGDIHILMTEHMMGGEEYQILAYTRSEDGGSTWLNPVAVDSVTSQVATITASPTGEVAIVYLRPTDYSAYNVVKNDVCYFESVDGRTWDFRYPTNITDYLNDNEDIFCPWGQDAVYDDDGNLHITWVINNIAMDGSFIDDATGLCYYNTVHDLTEVVAEFTDTDLSCDPGPMNSAISMPTISVSLQDPGPGINVLITFTGFIDTDVSADNHCVGDLYVVEGSGFWHLWAPVTNVTESHTPNCMGDCESEEFPSLSEMMNGALEDSAHLTYVMRNYGDNPDTVYYLPIELIIVTGVNNTEIIPLEFDLIGNFPNPFNARTTIEFALPEPGDVELTIYDITGARVETIRRQDLDAGKHFIVWDAKDAASGVYFARMEVGGYEESIKMVLLK